MTDKARALAEQYIAAGVFPDKARADARHVAAAVLAGCSALASWNFGHLVNVTRRTAVNELNESVGLPRIEIVAPPEL